MLSECNISLATSRQSNYLFESMKKEDQLNFDDN